MDSEDYTSEDAKRKREAEDILFNRSKKTHRTPDKKKDEKLDLLIDLVRGLTLETKQIRQDQEETKNEIRKIREENKQLIRENQEIREENKNMKKHINEVENRLERMEKEKRMNNVIVNGLNIDTADNKILKKTVERLFEEQLQVRIEVSNTVKLGEKTCLVQLKNEKDKELVMDNKFKLQALKNERIFINHDMTKMDREKMKEIRKIAKQEKEKGKQVKIGYNKIEIDGIVWRWNKMMEKLEKDKKN